jgi:hypothetical protein
MESTITRNIGGTTMVLLAALAAACGGSTQNVAGTVPSLVSPIAAATDGTGTLSLFKEGKGKGGHDTPTIGTTPDPDGPDAGDDAGIGDGQGHGKATIQIEGVAASIDGDCPALTIVMKNNITVTTVDTVDLTTEFQRATCAAIKAAGGTETPVHLHIAARKQGDGFVAVYVRMQGPKGDDGDNDPGEEENTTPTTTTN